MPRPAKPARLWLGRNAPAEPAQWFILDRGRKLRTGCAERARREAESALARYLAERHDPAPGKRRAPSIPVADVLSVYLDRVVETLPEPGPVKRRIARLNDRFGALMLSDVTPTLCRDYAAERSAGGARRDLEDLRAAIRFHEAEGLHEGEVRIPLPPKGPPRSRWLTRGEAARLIWTAYRYDPSPPWHAEARRLYASGMPRKRVAEALGRPEASIHYATREAAPARPLRHLARFLLLGLYTGTRPGAILSASIFPGPGRSWVDLDRGRFYRLAEGKVATNKRAPPAPLPPRLLAHLRRWHERRLIAQFVVEFRGKPVRSIKTAWSTLLEAAGMEGEDVSPHNLRHTAATWLMQAGVPIWEAAGFLGMSEKVLRETYGHHHPDFMSAAVEAIARRPAARA